MIRVTAEPGTLTVGPYDASAADRARAMVEALAASGIEAGLSEDIWATLWEKFIRLSAFSALTAATRLDIGPIRNTPAARHLLRSLVEETAAVARADHPSVPANAADTAYEFLVTFAPNAHASMLDDLLRGKRLELDWLSGEVVRRGAKLGIPTPSHAFACAVLAPHADGRPQGSH